MPTRLSFCSLVFSSFLCYHLSGIYHHLFYHLSNFLTLIVELHVVFTVYLSSSYPSLSHHTIEIRANLPDQTDSTMAGWEMMRKFSYD